MASSRLSEVTTLYSVSYTHLMDENRAMHQDIRPIYILILNLMPLKEETELQLLRSLSNTPLQVEDVYKRQPLFLLMRTVSL